MAKYVGWIVGLAIFGGWMSIVGNPHVVETVIGIVLATCAGVWAYLKVRNFGRARAKGT